MSLSPGWWLYFDTGNILVCMEKCSAEPTGLTTVTHNNPCMAGMLRTRSIICVKECLFHRSPHRSPQQVQNTEIAMRTVRGWAPPLLGPLPDDFLRLTPTPWGVSQKKQVCVAVNATSGVVHVDFNILNSKQ